MTASHEQAGEAVAASRTINIDPIVALEEQVSLARYWQNRAMVLAQQLHEARTALEMADAALAAAQAEA